MKDRYKYNKKQEVIIYPKTSKEENISAAGKECEYCRNTCKNHWNELIERHQEEYKDVYNKNNCEWFCMKQGFIKV